MTIRAVIVAIAIKHNFVMMDICEDLKNKVMPEEKYLKAAKRLFLKYGSRLHVITDSDFTSEIYYQKNGAVVYIDDLDIKELFKA